MKRTQIKCLDKHFYMHIRFILMRGRMDDHKHVTLVYCCIMIYSTHTPDNTFSSSPLTFNPRSVQGVGSEPPLDEVLARDALPVLVIVTNTLVGEQAD